MSRVPVLRVAVLRQLGLSKNPLGLTPNRFAFVNHAAFVAEEGKSALEVSLLAEPHDRNVYILGAGFSASAGAPPIHDFWDRSCEFLLDPTSGLRSRGVSLSILIAEATIAAVSIVLFRRGRWKKTVI